MNGLRQTGIGNALLAVSWLLGLEYYHRADGAAWMAVMILGVVLLAGGDSSRTPPRRLAGLAVLMLLPAVWVAPWPFKAGPALLLTGFALAALPVPARWVGRLGVGLAGAGWVHLAQGISLVGYRGFTARFVDLPEGLVGLLAALGNLAGGQFAADGSRLALYSMRELHSLAATWNLLLDPATAGFAGGALMLWVLRGSGGGGTAWLKDAARILAAILLWLPLRAILLLGIYSHRALRTPYEADLALLDQFWSPWVHLALLAVPVALLWRWPGSRPDASLRPPGSDDLPASAPASWVWSALGAGGAVFLCVLAWAWEPVGPRNEGRVLVDDYHSLKPWPMKEYDTTRTDRRFDTSWWGRDSSYNHACIFDYASRFYRVSRQTEPLTDAALASVDVLVLKVPSDAYSPAEQEAVRRFVERGGGLFLMGEHTSVFGCGVYLNAIAASYGFRFRYDCAFGIDSVFDQTYTPPLVPHPIVQFIRTMEFATSCTLDVGGAWGRPVMLCTGLKSLGADYHSSNFYPLPRDRPEMRSGAFVQLWAARQGQGRVAAFTDSTIFSNFTVFEPGKSELMMGLLEWLNRRNAWWGWRWLLGALALTLAIRVARSGRALAGQGMLMGAAGLCGWALAVSTARGLNHAEMPYPAQNRPCVRVAIDQGICRVKMPKNGFISGFVSTNLTPYATDFGQIERLALRLGYFTRRTQGLDFAPGNVLVLPFPNAVRQDELQQFEHGVAEYVARGGHVLVLDAPENVKSRANTLLARYGLRLKRQQPLPSGPLAAPQGWPAPSVNSAFEVEGGTAFAWLAGRPVAAWTRHGEGTVCVLGFGSRFRDDQMGPSGDVEPQGEVKAGFEYFFRLLPALVTGSLPPPGTSPVATLTSPPTPAAVTVPAQLPRPATTNTVPANARIAVQALPATTNLVEWRTWFDNHAPLHGWTNRWWTNDAFLARWLADRAARLATNTPAPGSVAPARERP